MYVPTLIIMPFSTRTGFAIEKLESTFFNAARQLNDGDASRVHFGFTSLHEGQPGSLPHDFGNLVEFDCNAATAQSVTRLQQYLRAHQIRFAMLFDVQPVSSIVRDLRSAGVQCVLSYWGAEISSPFSGARLHLKRLQVALAGRRRVDGLIFESRAMADLAIAGRGCPRSMLDVVPTGIDLGRFRVSDIKGYLQAEFGIPAGKKVVLFSGHAHERKGVGPMLDAAVILRRDYRRDDLFFLICGNRSGEAEQWLKRIAGTRAESSVMFAGYRTDMPVIMSHADIGIIPSSGWDSFPMSALEMAACGLPIVATRLGGIPEAVLHEQTGLLCEPGNARELAHCLARLAHHPDEVRAFGRYARERAEREFSVQAHEGRLLDVWTKRIGAAAAG